MGLRFEASQRGFDFLAPDGLERTFRLGKRSRCSDTLPKLRKWAAGVLPNHASDDSTRNAA